MGFSYSLHTMEHTMDQYQQPTVLFAA